MRKMKPAGVFSKYAYREALGEDPGHLRETSKRRKVTLNIDTSSTTSALGSSSSSRAAADLVDTGDESELKEKKPSKVVAKLKTPKITATSTKPRSFYPPAALISSGDAYCAPAPNKYRCRFKSTCDDCFLSSKQCEHGDELPLLLLLIGHNPSTHVWVNGYNYGNPTNRMWKLLTGELGDFDGLVPRASPIEFQNRLPEELQIGLTDVALVPGNDASELSPQVMMSWRPSLYARLSAHVDRVNQQYNGTYKGPKIYAFTGKRQFTSLYHASEIPKNVPFGKLPGDVPLPTNWPFADRNEFQIWVLPSSSGRAAMTHEQRFTPYKLLAEEVRRIRSSLLET